MRPVSSDCDGAAPPESLSRSRPVPAAEMSLLQSLGPVQNWLGQELEKCGIDAVIYTRYVLSLLLHDSYDYDLQDQVSPRGGLGVRAGGRGSTPPPAPVSVSVRRRTTSSWAGRREPGRSGARAGRGAGAT